MAEVNEIKSGLAGNAENKTEDLQRTTSLNLAEFLSQLEDYTPTVNICSCNDKLIL